MNFKEQANFSLPIAYNKILRMFVINFKFQIQENINQKNYFLGISGGVLRGQSPLNITPDRDTKMANVVDIR